MKHLYLAPAVALLLVVLAIPLGRTIAASRGHYGVVLGDESFRSSAVNTLVFTGLAVSIEFVLGIAFALLLHGTFRLRGLTRAVALIPWALPTAVMAVSWKYIFSPSYGVADDILLRLGLAEGGMGWLTRPGAAMAALVIADVWKTTPFVTIIVLAGLQSIPSDLYESLSIDGAGAIRRFFLLTLPLLRPAIALALLFRVIHTLGIFDLVWVLTQGGPADSTKVSSMHVFEYMFSYLEPGSAAAATVLMAVAMFLIGGGAAAVARGRST